MSKINETCIEKCRYVKLFCIFKKSELALQSINNHGGWYLGPTYNEFHNKKVMIPSKTIINCLEFIIDSDLHDKPINVNVKKQCKRVIKKLKDLPKDVLIDLEN